MDSFLCLWALDRNYILFWNCFEVHFSFYDLFIMFWNILLSSCSLYLDLKAYILCLLFKNFISSNLSTMSNPTRNIIISHKSLPYILCQACCKLYKLYKTVGHPNFNQIQTKTKLNIICFEVKKQPQYYWVGEWWKVWEGFGKVRYFHIWC